MRTGSAPDEMIRANGRALAGAFDRYVCTNSTNRPRPDVHAVPRLLHDGIVAGGGATEAVACIPDHEEAMRYTLSAAQPGDLVVINTNLIDKVLGLLEDLEAGRS
jgi:cyanophycin synthetase